MNFTQQEIQNAYLKVCMERLASLNVTQIEQRLETWKKQLEILKPHERLESLLNFLSVSNEDFDWAIKTSLPQHH